ncbi:MAG: hypothetical protein EXR64_04585, partial [Dehalococcoidia bacterium]|nr:hypothetical protein [Dehalococcoidia bacterium]
MSLRPRTADEWVAPRGPSPHGRWFFCARGGERGSGPHPRPLPGDRGGGCEKRDAGGLRPSRSRRKGAAKRGVQDDRAAMTSITPALNDVRRMVGQGDIVPIYREVRADLETPVSAYLKIARGPYSFLLESVEGGERQGRYSFIGTEPHRVVAAQHADGDPLLAVEAELSRSRSVEVPGLPRFHGGAVGYLGYEAVTHFEPRVPVQGTDVLGVPESWLMFTDTLLVFDHVKHTIKVVAHVRLDGDIDAAYAAAVRRIEVLIERLGTPLGALPYVLGAGPRGRAVTSNWEQPRFLDAVRRAKQYIAQGDVIQVVLSQRFTRETGAHPFEVYRSLRAINPSPYLFFLHFDDTSIVGSSPELLVNIEEGVVEVHPIAGTRPR